MFLYYLALILFASQSVLMAIGGVVYRKDRRLRWATWSLCIFFLMVVKVVWDGMVRQGYV